METGTSTPLGVKFNSIVYALIIFMLETKGRPLGKIDAIKNITEMLYCSYRALRLPTPPFPSIDKFGIVPVDIEVLIYRSPEIDRTDEEINIPDATRPLVLEKCRQILSDDTIELIKSIVENHSKKVGKDFSSWVQYLGIRRESISKGNEQIDKYLLGPSEDPMSWIFNPALLDYMSKDSDIFSAGTFIRGEHRKEFSPKHAAYLHCKSLLRTLAVTEKKKLVDTNKTWIFRVGRLAVSQNSEEKTMVLYVGRVEKVGNRYYFVDALYNTSNSNYVEINYFDGIETDCVYAMVGQLVERNFVNPYGLLKLNRINQDCLFF